MQRLTLCLLAAAMAGSLLPGQVRPTRGMVGKPGTGATVLSGYFVEGKPCLPLKKFTLDAGYEVNISPSGRHVGIVVEKKISMLLDGKSALVQNQKVPLSVQPVARDNDYFLPLEFFEKAFPAQFRYNGNTKVVVARFSEKKVLRVPIKPLPAKP